LTVLTNFGDVFKGAMSVKGTLYQVDGTQSSRDATLTFNKENNLGTLELKEAQLG
jgi:hypothetical protein